MLVFSGDIISNKSISIDGNLVKFCSAIQSFTGKTNLKAWMGNGTSVYNWKIMHLPLWLCGAITLTSIILWIQVVHIHSVTKLVSEPLGLSNIAHIYAAKKIRHCIFISFSIIAGIKAFIISPTLLILDKQIYLLIKLHKVADSKLKNKWNN